MRTLLLRGESIIEDGSPTFQPKPVDVLIGGDGDVGDAPSPGLIAS